MPAISALFPGATSTNQEPSWPSLSCSPYPSAHEQVKEEKRNPNFACTSETVFLLFLLSMLPATHLLSAHFPPLTAAHHSSPCSFLLIHLTRHLPDLPCSKTMTRLFCSVREVCAQLAPWPQMAAREQPGQASRPLPPTERGGPR